MKKYLTLLLAILFANIVNSQSQSDINLPYIKVAIEDFLKRKDSKKSDVFAIYSDNIRLNHNELILIEIIPEDSCCAYLLSNADGINKPYIYDIHLIEIKNKLFHWLGTSTNVLLRQKIVDKLIEYNFIKRIDVPTQEWLLGAKPNIDFRKIRQYYFIKGEYEKYKTTYSEIRKIPKKYME